jgi:DNA polymerase III delta prime subunit
MNFFVEEDKTPDTITHTLWCEKYRPVKLEDYVGGETLRAKVKQYITENDIPHLLLFGGAGTGKTTLAKIITNSIKCDTLYINASDENGIETIRGRIKSFASSMGFAPLKVIILDEADGLTPAGQSALRNMMETYSNHTRFILTCNHHERIIDPIQSRCQLFEISPPSKKEVAATLIKILRTETVKFDRDGIIMLVNSHYPDIRAIINTAQRGVLAGELKLDKEDILLGDLKSRLIEFLKMPDKNQAFTVIRQMIADNSIKNFSDFYTEMYEKIDEYAPNNQGAVIICLADGQQADVIVPDREICFAATIYKVLNQIK